MSLLPAHLSALLGQSVHAVDTPSLVIDLDAMQRNLLRMAEFAKKHHLRWRPHAKLHKCAELAQAQMGAGAVGVCVQKTAEAEALLTSGVYDLYISNEVIAPHKLARVAALAQDAVAHGGKLAIAVDSTEGVIRLAQAMNNARAASGAATLIDVFVEIDVGQGRCGVTPGTAAVKLALEIQQHPALQFVGLQAYHGKAQHIRSAQGRRAAIAQAVQAVAMTRQLIEAEGLQVKLVTGAGTGSFLLEAASGVYDELQVGSFLFMDADYAGNEPELGQPAFEHALFVKTQIISTHADYVVCDAGHKSHAIDSGLPRVLWHEGRAALTYFNGGDEHGILRVAEPGSTDQPDSVLPALGQTLWMIPGHCDPTVNLHDHLIGVRGGLQQGTVQHIYRVDARGALT